MIFSETKLPGVFIIDPEPFEDERGFFARLWSQPEFDAYGIDGRLVESNISFNSRKGILRGLHYQAPPYEQSKLVRCTLGSIYDVAVDLRADSPTRHQWVAVELTQDNHRMLFIPGWCAHGYQTLTERSEIFYQMSNFYNAESSRGVRWNDPAFGIKWPLPDPIMIDRDRNYEFVNRTAS